MFKRVAKRQRKMEREDELGLDGDMKQLLGLQDTDSDESDSSSSDNSDNESDTRAVSLKRKRGGPPDTGSVLDDEDEQEDEGEEEDILEDDEDISQTGSQMSVDDGAPPIGVMAATTTPIYDVPDAPATQDLQACIICPGKQLKSVHMVKVHLESTAHIRRMQRYTAAVAKLSATPEGLTTDDPRAILRTFTAPTPAATPVNTATPSKRSLRKAAQKLKNAERRKTRKEKTFSAKDKDVQEKPLTSVTDPNVAKDGKSPTKEQKALVGKEKKNGPRLKKDKKKGDAAPGAVLMDIGDAKIKRKGKSSDPSKKANSGKAEDSRPKKRQKQDAKTDLNHDEDTATPNNTPTSSLAPPPLKRYNTSQYFADDEKGTLATQPEQSRKTDMVKGTKQWPKRQASLSGNRRAKGGGKDPSPGRPQR